MTKAEGDALAKFVEFIDNKWLELHGYEERVAVRCLGFRDAVPADKEGAVKA